MGRPGQNYVGSKLRRGGVGNRCGTSNKGSVESNGGVNVAESIVGLRGRKRNAKVFAESCEPKALRRASRVLEKVPKATLKCA